ncbi:MAG: hypothetical protein ACOCW3_03085 [Spirochaetota bacterium]
MTVDLMNFSPYQCFVEAREEGAIVITAAGPHGAIHTTDRATIDTLLAQRYIVIEAENLVETNVACTLFFWRESSLLDEPDMMVPLGLFPGLPARLSFDLKRLDGQRLFLDRTPGKLKSMAFGSGMEPDEVACFGIGIIRSGVDARMRVSALWSQDEEPAYPLPEVTLVDEIGQWKTHEWDGKTAGLADLRGYLARETAGAMTMPSPPQGAARWGGFDRDRMEATGHFRVENDGSRYHLVDPDGYPFYSLGLDVVSERMPARVDGIEKLFEWLPPREGELSEFWMGETGRFPGAQHVDFLGANLRRALGENWFDAWAAMTERRMREWGFNTIGNWSSSRFIGASALPYVVPLAGSIGTERSIFRDFPDVFSDEFAAAAEKHARQLERFSGDRRLLGYFIMNEPHWAFIDRLNLAEKLLANPERLASRDAFISWLSDRYGGNAGNLSAAWEVDTIRSFSDLRRPLENVSSLSEAAAADLDEFNTILIRRFARLPCEAAKRTDPNHLNLGMRYAWISQPALYETGAYFDVFSINRYAPSAREAIDEIGERSGKPVMIGEFHHGALDAGLPSNGIRGVRTQAERARAYRYFVETSAASPWSVGVHYFTLNDQPILGRFDGENFQIGVVDICQRPYRDFVSGVRETNGSLDEIVYGERAPTDDYPEEATIGF